MSSLRLVTLNVAGLGHDWRRARAPVAVAGLTPLSPDIVCLQETTVCIDREAFDQAQDLGASLGLYHSVFTPYGNPAEVMAHNQGGLAVVSRWPLKTVRSRRLPSAHSGHSDARVAQLVTVVTPDGEVNVVNTHLSWRPEEAEIRMVQIGLILEEAASFGWLDEGRRTLFVGDLNATEDEPCIALAADRLQDAWRALHPEAPGHTWCRTNPYAGSVATHPDRRLDYVLVPRGVEVTSAEVVLTEKAPVMASDHYGVSVGVEW